MLAPAILVSFLQTTNTTQSSIVHDFTYFTALNFHSTHFRCFDDCSKYITFKQWYTLLQILVNVFKMEMDKCIRNNLYLLLLLPFHHFPDFTLDTLPCFYIVNILIFHLTCTSRSSQPFVCDAFALTSKPIKISPVSELRYFLKYTQIRLQHKTH